MKPITINVQISKCPKQYESVRLGGEWTVEDGETVAEVTAKAYAELNAMYDELTGKKVVAPENTQAQAQASADPEAKGEVKRQRLTFGDTKTVQAIVKRIEAGTKLEKVLEYYEPDEQTMHVLELAARMN